LPKTWRCQDLFKEPGGQETGNKTNNLTERQKSGVLKERQEIRGQEKEKIKTMSLRA